MARILYELAGRDGRRFSPYCWRSRLALAHKGLEATLEPCRFTEMEKIGFSGQQRVPVLADGTKTVADSWDIACHLEDTYRDLPPLFGGPTSRGLTRFVNDWTDAQLLPALSPCIVYDILQWLEPEDQDYFRRTREARFGRPLEEVHAEQPLHLANLSRVLAPLRRTLRDQIWISGGGPAYADYIVFGAFQWARCVSDVRLLEDDDPIRPWLNRMVVRFDGLADSVPHYDS